MKATGVVRRIDELGRIVIPKEIRKTLRIREGENLEIFLDDQENIVLKNQKKNTVTFKNIKPGVYYLKAHAYTLLNGIKQFGVWSDNKKVVVK